MPTQLTSEISPAPGSSFGGTAVGGSHATSASYLERRAWIGEYFDRTASTAWKTLTSDAPVSRVRATVRAGRDQMRHTLLNWLNPSLHGVRILDAGCGTGALAIDLAKRGAEVVAIDLSPTLIAHARERADEAGVSIEFHAGDMLDPALGTFDHVVAMDSLIHYNLPEMITALEALAPRVRERMLVTVVPGTPLLVAMRAVGRLFPKADRAPAIVPISERAFRAGLLGSRDLDTWGMVATRLIERGFYRSMAIALHHSTMGGRSGGVTSRRR
jgi:magnesium-protoporphyrin O-methyltransferase